MFVPLRSVCAVVVCFALAPVVVAQEPLSRVEVTKLTKPATALVEMKPRYGTAFCIHPSGLFITNEHVVKQVSDTGTVTIVLDSAQKTQQVYKAKVIRRDKDLDLALLRIEGAHKFPALALGSDKDLNELTELIAFGFPFGTALAKQGEYPAISVNVGAVTSLRRDKNGDLHRIQVDAVLNPGNSGGPVMDRHGKVVGVVVSGIQGSGINMAIPVSHVTRFVARPELAFTPPVVNRANQHQPVEFRASAISLLAETAKLELELVLTSPSKQERRFPMTLAKDGTYQVKAIPFPAPAGPPTVRVEIKFDNGSVSGTAEDHDINIGKQTIKLSQLSKLHLGANPKAQTSDNRTLEGELTDFVVLPVKVGKQTLNLNLTNASEIAVAPPVDGASVSCTVVAKHAKQEVARLSAPLYAEGVARPSLEAIRDGKFIRPGVSPAPNSYAKVISSPGDFIGQGKTYNWTAQQMTVRRNVRGVSIAVDGFDISFGAAGNGFLQVGEYNDAKRFSGETPSINFSGQGRGCNQISGKFVVWELEVQGNNIVRLAVDFIQRCENTMPPLYGMIRFNSTLH